MERLHKFRRSSQKWFERLKRDKKVETEEVHADFCFQTDLREETFSVSWCVENLHRCSLEPGQCLESPTFSTGFSNEVNWNLRIYPKGRKDGHSIGLFVHQITTESITSLRYRMPVKLTFLPCSGEAQQLTIDGDEVVAFDGTEEVNFYFVNGSAPESSPKPENPREYGTDDLMSSEYLERVKSFQVTCYITVTYVEEASRNIMERVKSSTLSGDLRELLETGRFSDVTLQVEQKQFPAHKAILASRSKALEAQLQENQCTDTIELEGVDSSVVDSFLQYVYTGRVDEFSVDRAAGLLPAAHRYCLDELKRACVETLMACLDVRNVCRIAAVADFHSETKLKKAVNYLFRQRKHDILQSKEWEKLIQEKPRLASDILQAMTLDFHTEL